MDKLMDADDAADCDPVVDMNVTCHIDGVGNDDVIADLAVVRYVGILHNQVVVADDSRFLHLIGAVYGHKFADGVVTAYN